MKHHLALAAAVAAALAVPSAGHASVANATFQVTANVVGACTIAATDMAFGNYSFASGNTSTSTITVNCVGGSTPYNIELDNGLHGSGSAGGTIRYMMSGGGTLLGYNLYVDAARTTVWSTGAANRAAGTANPSTATTVYGTVPAGQGSPLGSYVDTVTATLNY